MSGYVSASGLVGRSEKMRGVKQDMLKDKKSAGKTVESMDAILAAQKAGMLAEWKEVLKALLLVAT